MSYLDDCKEFIRNEIRKIEGKWITANDIGVILYDDDVRNEIFSLETDHVLYIVDSWGSDIRVINTYLYDEMKYTYNEVNASDHPELFYMIALVEGACSIITDVPYISNHWDENIEMTRESINTILNEVALVSSIRFNPYVGSFLK